MSQYTINIGALPNDGTGDPLRTAFNDVNLNFNQVFAAGPVLSNVQIANNTILTTNTNGNLVLAPNGTAVVQSNVSIVPNTANIRNLGSTTQRWATVYSQYINTTQINSSGTLITTPVPLVSLSAVAGARAFINNSNLVAAGNFGAQVGGGGANTVPVWSDGTNWYIG